MKTVSAFALALFALAPSPGFGHPMGNFSVNRYARLEPSEREVTLVYVVDFAEIPTFQEISNFPRLAADTSAEALNRSPERAALASELASAWAPGLRLGATSGAIPLHKKEQSLEFSPGAGGLSTMKLRLSLAGSWPPGMAEGALDYRDTNAPERLGWREVVVRAGPGVALTGDFSTEDRSRELTDYPANPTADIPQVVTASFRARLAGPVAGLDPLVRSLRANDFATTPRRERPQGSPPAPPARLAREGAETRAPASRAKEPEALGAGRATAATDGGALFARGPQVVTPPKSRSAQAGYVRSDSRAARPAISTGTDGTDRGSSRRSDRFADLISRERLTPGIVLLSLLIAACLGGLHALSPGHGKTVVAAYLVGSRGTAKHALLLGLVVTASHTIGVFLLGIVTLALSKAIVPEKLYPAIQFLSGLAIVAIGFSLFVKRFRRAPAGHGHSHEVEVPESAPTASALLALGVSGGILPCPSALVVLLSAIALHRIGFGLALIVAFSAGLASVLSGIGILVVRAGRLLNRFEPVGRWAKRLPAFSALLIGVLGLAIAARAFADVQKAFF